MQPKDRERLLWRLAETEGPRDAAEGGPGGVPDDVLRAFQRGLLDAHDEAEVVRQLTRDPASRRRLLTLTDVAPPPAPNAVLERLLNPPRRSRRLRPILLAAAALIAVVLGWWWYSVPTGLPPAYAVTMNGLVHQRGTGQAAGGQVPSTQPDADADTVSAYAETPVTITATVAGAARANAEVGLFRFDSRRGRITLVQVVEADGLVRTDRRGAVQLTAPAVALVGEKPGMRSVFVVVAWPGDLPSSIEVPHDRDPEATLAAGGRRRVHRLPLRLLSPNIERDDPEPVPRR